MQAKHVHLPTNAIIYISTIDGGVLKVAAGIGKGGAWTAFYVAPGSDSLLTDASTSNRVIDMMERQEELRLD